MIEPQRIRRAIRAGEITGTSRGLALGYVQCNVVILPRAFAHDFLVYCHRDARACRLLEVGDPGDPVPRTLSPTADIRTDVARYAVWRDGARQTDMTDIAALWRDDLVLFLIGSGIIFDGALERAGVPTDRHRWVLHTDRPTVRAGPFHGPLAVTMRWLTPQRAIRAATITARFPRNHGAPIHIGDPAAIGADLDRPLFGGPVPPLPDGLMPVFRACGVAPQAAAEAARPPLVLAHAPAHSFVTDLPAEELMV